MHLNTLLLAATAVAGVYAAPAADANMDIEERTFFLPIFGWKPPKLWFPPIKWCPPKSYQPRCDNNYDPYRGYPGKPATPPSYWSPPKGWYPDPGYCPPAGWQPPQGCGWSWGPYQPPYYPKLAVREESQDIAEREAEPEPEPVAVAEPEVEERTLILWPKEKEGYDNEYYGYKKDYDLWKKSKAKTEWIKKLLYSLWYKKFLIKKKLFGYGWDYGYPYPSYP